MIIKKEVNLTQLRNLNVVCLKKKEKDLSCLVKDTFILQMTFQKLNTVLHNSYYIEMNDW